VNPIKGPYLNDHLQMPTIKDEDRLKANARLARYRQKHRAVSLNAETVAKIPQIMAHLVAENGSKCTRADAVAYAIDVACNALKAPTTAAAPVANPALPATPLEAATGPLLTPSLHPQVDPGTNQATSKPTPSMTGRHQGIGYDLWVEPLADIVVVFVGPDERKELLKALGFVRLQGSLEWRLTVRAETVEKELSSALWALAATPKPSK